MRETEKQGERQTDKKIYRQTDRGGERQRRTKTQKLQGGEWKEHFKVDFPFFPLSSFFAFSLVSVITKYGTSRTGKPGRQRSQAV